MCLVHVKIAPVGRCLMGTENPLSFMLYPLGMLQRFLDSAFISVIAKSLQPSITHVITGTSLPR